VPAVRADEIRSLTGAGQGDGSSCWTS